MYQTIISVGESDLESGAYGLDASFSERVRRRIEDRKRYITKHSLRPITKREERNILVGELGELILRKDLMSRGYAVVCCSWTEFNRHNGYETTVDLEVHDGTRSIKYQVKSSESGIRAIQLPVLQKLLSSPVDFITFVAVRELVDENGKVSYEGAITSQMRPSHIKRLATWERTPLGFVHKENDSFTKQWTDDSLWRSLEQGDGRYISPRV